MNNYEYCAHWARSNPGTVLDYGCGAGQVVQLLRASGREAYGCDTFFEGGDYSPDVSPELLGTVIRRMEGNHVIPFPDASFDVVISNFVFEHVDDLDAVLKEVARVMKPGGVMLSMFPSRSVWIESHCRIPFLHRFKKGGKLRVYYAALLSWAGIGAPRKPGERPLAWAKRICVWLDQWTFYRSTGQVNHMFGKYFARIEFIEDQWLKARKPALSFLPRRLQLFLVRHIGALAMVSAR